MQTFNFVSATAIAILTLFSLGHPRALAQVVSTQFQNGTNGYTGTFDRLLSTDIGAEILGADTASYFFDGANAAGSSPDTQGLIRFDDIIGAGDHQIPAGATILSAHLTVNTSVRGNAQTSGPYGVSGLLPSDLMPFDEFLTYEDFEANENSEAFSRGAWWQDGSATRPTGGFGFQIPGQSDSANVTSIVQAWVDGTYDNNGFVIQAGRSDIIAEPANTADGWAIRSTGYPIAETRPRLDIEYTMASIEMNVFQNGADSYDGTTLAFVRSGLNGLIEDADDFDNPERTEDGADFDQTFLDGVQFDDSFGATSSPDDFALLKFDNVFGSDAGQAPLDVPVARAWAVLTTGDTSANSQSTGPWSAHSMLRSWDTTTLHSSFGDVNGLQVDDGDISPALDKQDGFIRGAEVWFDITDHLEGVRNGAEDFGIAIVASGTADGWQIHSTGSTSDTVGETAESARPRLVVYSGLIADPAITADCNGDGTVDAMDLACVDSILMRDEVLFAISSVPGDLDGNGKVDFSDFLTLSGNFGVDTSTSYTDGDIDLSGGPAFNDFLTLSGAFGFDNSATAAAVPEPSSLALLAVGAVVTGARRRRRV